MVDLVDRLVPPQSLLKPFSGLSEGILLILLSFALEEAEAFPEVLVLALQFHEEVAHEAQQGQILIDVVLAPHLAKHLEQVGYLGRVCESFSAEVVQHNYVLDFAIEALDLSEVAAYDVVVLVKVEK